MTWIHFKTQLVTIMAQVDADGNTVQTQRLEQSTGLLTQAEFEAMRQQIVDWMQNANKSLAE